MKRSNVIEIFLNCCKASERGIAWQKVFINLCSFHSCHATGHKLENNTVVAGKLWDQSPTFPLFENLKRVQQVR